MSNILFYKIIRNQTLLHSEEDFENKEVLY